MGQGLLGLAVRILLLLCLGAVPLLGDSFTLSPGAISYTGNLPGTPPNPNGQVELQFTLNSSANIVIQTFGYGGGTNAAGTMLTGTGAEAGFFSAIGLYNAAGSLLLDSTVNNEGGCSPGTAQLDSLSGCGDLHLNFFDALGTNASAGSFTLALFAGSNVPTSTLSALQASLNAGSLDRTDLQAGTSFYAVDVASGGGLSPSGPVNTPEPPSLLLLGAGLAPAALRMFRRKVGNARRRWRLGKLG